MNENTDIPSIERIEQLISETFSPTAIPRIQDYIQEKLPVHLAKMLAHEKTITNMLNTFSNLSRQENEVIINYMGQVHISTPKIDNVIDAVTWHKDVRNAMPITEENMSEIIANYNATANTYRKKLLALYRENSPDREIRINVGVRYCMVESAARRELDFNNIAEKIKSINVN